MSAPAPMGLFERYLTLWVALCIVAGILLAEMIMISLAVVSGGAAAEDLVGHGEGHPVGV